VAYVRKVRTASGAVAVQVARKEAGKVMIIEHVGSARTDAELGVLLQRARGLVDGLQEVLDLEVARRVARLDEVSDWRPPDQQQPVADAVAGPGRTVATNSRLLYEAIGAVYDALGFDALADVVFKDLVIARVVEPTSKLDSARVLTDRVQIRCPTARFNGICGRSTPTITGMRSPRSVLRTRLVGAR